MSRGAILILIVSVLLAPPALAGTYSGGTGTAKYPYIIADANDLNEIGLYSGDWDKHFILVDDIDLSIFTGTGFNMIGTSSNPFSGSLDGNGYAVSNFTITDIEGTNTDIGMFRCIAGESALIKDLTLIEPNVDCADYIIRVGSLAGTIEYGATLNNCVVQGGFVAGNADVGGLVGYVYRDSRLNKCHTVDIEVLVRYDNKVAGGVIGESVDSTVTDCSSSGLVSGAGMLGGLVGHSSGCKFIYCHSSATVSATGNDCAGGLIGLNLFGMEMSIVSECSASGNVTGNDSTGGLIGSFWDGIVVNCRASGNITGFSRAGGLVGYQVGGEIFDSYASGSVEGDSCVGGLIGNKSGIYVKRCYSTGYVAGSTDVGGLIGCLGSSAQYVVGCFWDNESSNQMTSPAGTGLPTEDMQKIITFTDAGWDFVGEDVNGTEDIWRMCVDAGHYPHLWWQYSTLGDFDCPDGVGLEDILMLTSHWLEMELEPLQSPDATGDGKVNLDDFAITSQNFLTQ
jgi:hypothetical protein